MNSAYFVRLGFESGCKRCGLKRMRGDLWVKHRDDFVLAMWLQRSRHGHGWFLNLAVFSKRLEPGREFKSWKDIHVDARAHEFMQHDITNFNRITSEVSDCSGEAVSTYVQEAIVDVLYPELESMVDWDKFFAYANRTAKDAKWATYKRVMDLASQFPASSKAG